MKKFLSLFLAAAMLLSCTAALADDGTIQNPYFSAWAVNYLDWHIYMSEEQGLKLDDICVPDISLRYIPGYTVRTNGVKDQDVTDDGWYSANGTFTMGAGAGVTDDSLWYVSFTYYDSVDALVKEANTVFMVNALMDAAIIGELDENTLVEIETALIDATDNVAFEVDGMVLCAKPMFGLVMANSKAFYDAYYPNSIADYTKIR